MKINSVTFRNTIQDWGYEKIDFFDLTLLVGLSGAGKTQILESILTINGIAVGDVKRGIQWSIELAVGDNHYIWRGETALELEENQRDVYMFLEGERANILQEELLLNGELITSRDKGNIDFRGQKMPKLSQSVSLLKIFQEESVIKPVFEGFENLIFRDYTQKPEQSLHRFRDSERVKTQYSEINEIRESHLSIYDKLYYLYEDLPDIFDEIKAGFINLFPQVTDLRIRHYDDNQDDPFDSEHGILIKERDVEGWIPHTRMSSGMLRTLLHIAEMYLWPDGTVILIDEFENSLGVNCINFLTEDLIFENNRIQFIATSHHPYIINKIPYEYWKIVSRKGGEIQTSNASEFRLGDSKHDRFLNLVNLPQFRQKAS